MADLFIPTLHTFAMNNSFTGSWESFRFRAVPHIEMATAKEVDFEKSNIHVQYWHGPFCYEKSEIEADATFPLSEEGRIAMKKWLESSI